MSVDTEPAASPTLSRRELVERLFGVGAGALAAALSAVGKGGTTMIRVGLIVLLASAVVAGPVIPVSGVTGQAIAEERVIYIAAVEPKGGTTADAEPFPARELPKGPGYARKAPDATGRWEVSVYQWSPATVVVRQGDRVTLEIVGINGNVHAVHIDTYHPEHFVVKRGEVTRIQFTADTPGIFKIHCRNHEPTMEGQLVVLPR